MVSSTSHTEDLILATLHNGRKRQNEIIALLNRNDATVRRHLKKLVETGQIKKEKEEGKKPVFYFLPAEGRKPIEPLQSADQNEVSRILFGIKGRFGLLPEGVSVADSASDFGFYLSFAR